MDEQPDSEKEQSEINKIDLSALQGFSFGTQWTPAEKASAPRREGREREHQGPREKQAGAHPARDRRQLRRPAGDLQRPAPSQGQGEDQRGGQQPREPHSGSRDRRDRGPAQQQDNRPYLSNVFDIVFYPEDEIFHKIVQRVRDSKHTFELFEIARAVLAKSERCVIVVRRKPDPTGAQPPVHVSVVDGIPFETEDGAVDHVMRTHLGHFFDIAEVELEPPKGSFAVISRCGITGELLGPPNYHRYQSMLQQHHASRLPNMSFERFRERLESVREPEVIAAWLEKMKKGVRYTWKTPVEGTEAPVFDAPEEARNYLLANARDQVVRQLEHARFQGKLFETLADGEVRRAIEGQLERQRRFPLDSANALRGRLRREGFTIFKKGSKGVSYVCAVKRKFRVPGQSFADSINNLIQFIETNSLISIRELPAKMLGITMPLPPQPDAAPADAKPLSPEEETQVKKLLTDLRWLVSEGYVTEYSDGRLFAPPPAKPHEPREDAADEDDSAETTLPEDPVEPAPHEPTSEAPAAEAATESETEAPVVEKPAAEPPASDAPAAEAPADIPAPVEGESPKSEPAA
ncbi:MAG TPA: hypothetical protein VIK52_07875 [Opitutaceae bacterium]